MVLFFVMMVCIILFFKYFFNFILYVDCILLLILLFILFFLLKFVLFVFDKSLVVRVESFCCWVCVVFKCDFWVIFVIWVLVFEVDWLNIWYLLYVIGNGISMLFIVCCNGIMILIFLGIKEDCWCIMFRVWILDFFIFFIVEEFFYYFKYWSV